MSGYHFLASPFFAAIAALPCICTVQAQEGVVELSGPGDMLALWQNMCRNLQETARVRISPTWRVTPKQAIDVTMQDLNADSYGCEYEPASGIITIRPKYSSAAKLIAAHHNPALVGKLTEREKLALMNAQSRVQQLIQPGMGDYEKVLALHDEINAHAEFGRIQGDDCTEMLLNGKGVCEGYARALHVLLDMAGIPSRFAFGIAKGEKHLWNLVRVDGKWYHMDATWDDGMGGYGYFLLTDAELAPDHQWDRRRFHSTATEGYLYYRRNGLCPDTYPALWEGVLKAWKEGAEAYSCYFPAFGNRATFLRELRKFQHAHPEVRLDSWTGNYDGGCVLSIRFGRRN